MAEQEAFDDPIGFRDTEIDRLNELNRELVAACEELMGELVSDSDESDVMFRARVILAKSPPSTKLQ